MMPPLRRPPPPSAGPTLLRRAIDQSGLGVTPFAHRVLLRAPRSVYRWLAGTHTTPALIRTFLRDYLEAPE